MEEMEVLTLSGEEFVVVSKLEHEGKEYIYALSEENDKKFSILEKTMENGLEMVESVPKEQIKPLMEKFMVKLMKEKIGE